MNPRHVFLNCPFSEDYQTLFHAMVYAITRGGFVPRCALETDDSGQNRFEKICAIIAECQLGVHDISFTDLDPHSRLPRFNMPLEVGLFLGAKKFGRTQSAKRTLILDRDRFRYQTFMSDVAGQDIHAHGAQAGRLIEIIATWLRAEGRTKDVPGGRAMAKEFECFEANLPAIAAQKQLEAAELAFYDLRDITIEWIRADGGVSERR